MLIVGCALGESTGERFQWTEMGGEDMHQEWSITPWPPQGAQSMGQSGANLQEVSQMCSPSYVPEPPLLQCCVLCSYKHSPYPDQGFTFCPCSASVFYINRGKCANFGVFRYILKQFFFFGLYLWDNEESIWIHFLECPLGRYEIWGCWNTFPDKEFMENPSPVRILLLLCRVLQILGTSALNTDEMKSLSIG